MGSPEASSLVALLLEEHEMARTQIGAAHTVLADAQAGRAQAVVTLNRALSVYVEIIQPHIVRENDVLFPMVDRLLNERDQHELVAAFARIEAEILGPGVHERYHQLAHELAAGRTQGDGRS
jgi:hemerythrin-like domain-containing protein